MEWVSVHGARCTGCFWSKYCFFFSLGRRHRCIFSSFHSLPSFTVDVSFENLFDVHIEWFDLSQMLDAIKLIENDAPHRCVHPHEPGRSKRSIPLISICVSMLQFTLRVDTIDCKSTHTQREKDEWAKKLWPLSMHTSKELN